MWLVQIRLPRVYFNIAQDPRYIVYTRPTRFREIPQVYIHDIHDIHGIHGVKVEPLMLMLCKSNEDLQNLHSVHHDCCFLCSLNTSNETRGIKHAREPHGEPTGRSEIVWCASHVKCLQFVHQTIKQAAEHVYLKQTASMKWRS